MKVALNMKLQCQHITSSPKDAGTSKDGKLQARRDQERLSPSKEKKGGKTKQNKTTTAVELQMNFKRCLILPSKT